MPLDYHEMHPEGEATISQSRREGGREGGRERERERGREGEREIVKRTGEHISISIY